ncbi:MAG: hypothetical protein ACJAWS_002452 [Oleiphilaceae bacterium]|jgi:hypothetical protein
MTGSRDSRAHYIVIRIQFLSFYSPPKQSSRVITIRIRDENLSLLPWQAKKRLSGGGDGFL